MGDQIKIRIKGQMKGIAKSGYSTVFLVAVYAAFAWSSSVAGFYTGEESPPQESAAYAHIVAVFCIVMTAGYLHRDRHSSWCFWAKMLGCVTFAIAVLWGTILYIEPDSFPAPYATELFYDIHWILKGPAAALWFVYPLFALTLLMPVTHRIIRVKYGRAVLSLLAFAGVVFAATGKGHGFEVCDKPYLLPTDLYFILAGWYAIGLNFTAAHERRRGKYRVCWFIAAALAIVLGLWFDSKLLLWSYGIGLLLPPLIPWLLFVFRNRQSGHNATVLWLAILFHPLVIHAIRTSFFHASEWYCIIIAFALSAPLSIAFSMLLFSVRGWFVFHCEVSTTKPSTDNPDETPPKKTQSQKPALFPKKLGFSLIVLIILFCSMFYTIKRVVTEYNHDKAISKSLGALFRHQKLLVELQKQYGKIKRETYSPQGEVLAQIAELFSDEPGPELKDIAALWPSFTIQLVPVEKNVDEKRALADKYADAQKKNKKLNKREAGCKAGEGLPEECRDAEERDPRNMEAIKSLEEENKQTLRELMKNTQLSNIPAGMQPTVHDMLNDWYMKTKLEIGSEKDMLLAALSKTKVRQLLKGIHVHLVEPAGMEHVGPCFASWSDGIACLNLNVEVFYYYLKEVMAQTKKDIAKDEKLRKLLPRLHDWHMEIARAYCDCAPPASFPPRKKAKPPFALLPWKILKGPPDPEKARKRATLACAGSDMAMAETDCGHLFADCMPITECRGYMVYERLKCVLCDDVQSDKDFCEPLPRTTAMRYYELLDVVQLTGKHAPNMLRRLVEQPVFDANYIVDTCFKNRTEADPLLRDLYKLDIQVDITCKTLPGYLNDFADVDAFNYGLWELEDTLNSIDNRLINSFITWPNVVNIFVPFLAALISLGLFVHELFKK